MDTPRPPIPKSEDVVTLPIPRIDSYETDLQTGRQTDLSLGGSWFCVTSFAGDFVDGKTLLVPFDDLLRWDALRRIEELRTRVLVLAFRVWPLVLLTLVLAVHLNLSLQFIWCQNKLL